MKRVGKGDGVLGEINRLKVACTQTEENMDKKKGPAQKNVLFSIAGIRRDDRQHGTWMDAMSGKQANRSVSQKDQNNHSSAIRTSKTDGYLLGIFAPHFLDQGQQRLRVLAKPLERRPDFMISDSLVELVLRQVVVRVAQLGP